MENQPPNPPNAPREKTPLSNGQFSIHRSENSRPGAKPAAIVIQIRMKQPAASPRPVLYKKDGEFWLSAEK